MIKQQMNKKFWRTFGEVFLDALLLVAVILVFLWMKKVAFFAFSNEPYQPDSKAYVQMVVVKNDNAHEIGEKLERMGVIESHWYLQIRYQFSSYGKYHFQPGIYRVGPSMGVDDLIAEFTGR